MSDNHTGMLLEDINSKFDFLVEAVGQINDEMKTLAKQSDLEEVKADIKIVKAAVTDNSGQINSHEQRITRLETKAA